MGIKLPLCQWCDAEMTYDNGSRTITDGDEKRVFRKRVCPNCGAGLSEHQTTIKKWTPPPEYSPESSALPIPFPDYPGEGRMSPDTP